MDTATTGTKRTTLADLAAEFSCEVRHLKALTGDELDALRAARRGVLLTQERIDLEKARLGVFTAEMGSFQKKLDAIVKAAGGGA